MLEQWEDRQAANEAVWRLISQSQVAHLAERPRRHDGAAAKTRKRKAPARPNRRVRARATGGEVEPGGAPARLRALLPRTVAARAAATAEAAAEAARHAMAIAAEQVPAAGPEAAAAAPEPALQQMPAVEANAIPAAPAAHAEAAAPATADEQVHAVALAFSWPEVPAIAGVHNMVAEAGPVGPRGWAEKVAGTLECKWTCSSCG